MLATLDDVHLARLYGAASETALDPLTDREFEDLSAELRKVRSHGCAVNVEETEAGLFAIGAALVNRAGEAIGAFSVAAPSVRMEALMSEATIAAILSTKRAIEADVGELSVGGSNVRGSRAG